jgi:hypothetical protein
MENTNNINDETKAKKVYYESQKASRAFPDRNKDNEEYKQEIEKRKRKHMKNSKNIL